MKNNIEIISPNIEDVEAFIQNGFIRLCEFELTEDILPQIVANDAITRLKNGQDWFWCSPRLFLNSDVNKIVGSACFKNSPKDGLVEIGYGILELYNGKGFATAGIARILKEAFSRPDVKGVTAETSVNNIASQRVLEKNGFTKTGTREDPEDGSLIIWQCKR
jgi:RimJ/RimL family protein N-acetyltransferase